jgi:metal-sulfur cluster biosynthetic enzyme
MTLTSPACPVAETLPVDVENKLKLMPDVNNATVEITFDPPWEKDMMSEEAKLELGDVVILSSMFNVKVQSWLR